MVSQSDSSSRAIVATITMLTVSAVIIFHFLERSGIISFRQPILVYVAVLLGLLSLVMTVLTLGLQALQKFLESRLLSLQSETTGMDYYPLNQCLKAGDWRKADKLTKDMMFEVSHRTEEGFLDRASVESFPSEDLQLINHLWIQHSKGALGFSVQKKIWEQCGSPGPDYEANRSAWIQFGQQVHWYGGTGLEGWRRYEELDLEDPERGQLPTIGLCSWKSLAWGDWVEAILLSRKDIQ